LGPHPAAADAVDRDVRRGVGGGGEGLLGALDDQYAGRALHRAGGPELGRGVLAPQVLRRAPGRVPDAAVGYAQLTAHGAVRLGPGIEQGGKRALAVVRELLGQVLGRADAAYAVLRRDCGLDAVSVQVRSVFGSDRQGTPAWLDLTR